MNYTLLAALSFFVGIFVGLTGIGGASLITPMLILVFQVPTSVAIGSDVVAATLMKVVGAAKHCQQQTVNLQVVRWLVYGSVPGSLIGIAMLHRLQQIAASLDALLLRLLGMAILLITVMALFQMLLLIFAPQFQMPAPPKINLETLPGKSLAITIGTILGCVVGMTSISSGSMFALVLIAFFQLDAQKLVGTDLVQAAILLSFTSLGHLSLGTVDWSLVIAIWVGSIPGVLIGAKLCQLIPQRPLRFVLYMLLIMVSWKLVHFA
jgi:uncharacterized membrane protein YfcA